MEITHNEMMQHFEELKQFQPLVLNINPLQLK